MEDVEGGAVAVGDEKASRTEALGGVWKKQAETLVLKASEVYVPGVSKGQVDCPEWGGRPWERARPSPRRL